MHGKLAVWWVACLLALAVLGVAVSRVLLPQVPEGVYVVPASQSFGEIGAEDTSHTAVYRIINASDSPVNILRVATGCGCSELWVEKEVIPARSECEVKLRVDLTNRFGKQEFGAFITVSHPQVDQIGIRLHGSRSMSHLDTQFELGSFSPGASIETVVTVSHGGASAASATASLDSGILRAGDVVERGGTFRIPVTGVAPSKSGGFIQKLRINASGAAWREATVDLVGQVIDEWDVPSRVFFGIIGESEVTHVIRLRRNHVADALGKPLSTEDVSVKCTGDVTPETEVSVLENGSGYEFKLTLKGVRSQPGSDAGESRCLITVRGANVVEEHDVTLHYRVQ